MARWAAGGERPIGFVGLGAMGQPMATRLAGAGHTVIAYDADGARSEDLARLPEVSAARSPGDLRPAGVVVCMLPDSDAVEQVVAGRGGLLESLEPGALIVDMGSSEPARTVALARRVERAGMELVDSPVSGGVAGAGAGSLTTMFGGSEQQLEACRPALDAVAAKVIPVGEVGAGHATKALNNVMSAVGLTVACEVIEVGRRFGLDPDVMVDVLNESTGRNHATEAKLRQFVLSETFDSGFLLRLMLKDLDIAMDLAAGVDAPIRIGNACRRLWTEAAGSLPPEADQTEIARVVGRAGKPAGAQPDARGAG